MRLALLLCSPCLALLACGDAVQNASAPAAMARAASQAQSPPLPPPPALGTNLASIDYYASALTFTDLMKESSPFDPAESDDEKAGSTTLEKDADGWVRSLQGERYATLMRRGLRDSAGRPRHPAGDYVFLYDGEGEFRFRFDAKLVENDPKRGRALVRVRPSGAGIRIEVTRTNPENPMRNFRLLPAGQETETPPALFNPWFLEKLKPFGVLRFMDWQRTNDSPLVEWKDRTRPSSQTQASAHGVAVEFMVDLANELGADPWFCMPHQASDDFVRRFAELVRERLDPERVVYIEYSNEVWNGGFEQSDWAEEQGRRLGLGAPEGHRFYAQRSVEIFRIWEEAFGGLDRLRRVLASQNANPRVAEQILDFAPAGGPASHQDADYLAVAPYFAGMNINACDDGNEIARARSMRPEEILERARQHATAVLERAAENRRVAQARRNAQGRALQLVAYEGGPHLVGTCGGENDQELTDRLMATNRHPMMGDVYLEYLKRWQEMGGLLFAHFSSTSPHGKWGSWGFDEWYDAKRTPKREALETFAASQPR